MHTGYEGQVKGKNLQISKHIEESLSKSDHHWLIKLIKRGLGPRSYAYSDSIFTN